MVVAVVLPSLATTAADTAVPVVPVVPVDGGDGPLASNIGLPRTRPGFRSSIVLGLMATMLAPIGPVGGGRSSSMG